MVKGLRNIILTLLLVTAITAPCYAIELMDEDALNKISGKAGVTIIFDELVITSETGDMAIGGDDGLGVPEAPDGAWFLLENTREVTLNLGGNVVHLDCVNIEKTDTSYSQTLRTAIFNNNSNEIQAVAVFDLGEARFYSFSSDAVLTLSFGNNKLGVSNSGESLFAEEIARFQVDGSAMTVQSENAKVYVFAHPDGNFTITPPKNGG